MLWRTHLAMGLAAGYMVAGPDPVSLTAAGIAALLPDFDHPGSYAGRRAPVLSTVVRVSFGYCGVVHGLVAANENRQGSLCLGGFGECSIKNFE